MHKIRERVFLGHSQDAINKELLDKNGITVCLNCAIDLDYECDRQYFKVGLTDGVNNTIETLGEAVETLEKLVWAGEKVLVHCHSGMSRSVTVIAAQLAMTEYRSIYQALHEIAKIKEQIYPHAGLILLARELVEDIDGSLLRGLRP